MAGLSLSPPSSGEFSGALDADERLAVAVDLGSRKAATGTSAVQINPADRNCSIRRKAAGDSRTRVCRLPASTPFGLVAGPVKANKTAANVVHSIIMHPQFIV